MFGGRQCRGGRSWGFCGGLSWDEGVNAIEGQGILGEAGARREGFCIIEFAVLGGAADGAEADDIFSGGVHVGDHGRE